MKYLAAEIACFWYLLSRGMWRGERRCVIYALSGKAVVICADRPCRGSGCSIVTRMFWNPHEHQKHDIENFLDRQFR